MAIDRKPVTKPAEPHPFESFGNASSGGDKDRQRLVAAPNVATTDGDASPPKIQREGTDAPATRTSGRGRGSGPAKPTEQLAEPADPLVTRTYRIQESYDDRLQHGALVMGMRRGRSVNKSDLVREAIDEYLIKHNLDD